MKTYQIYLEKDNEQVEVNLRLTVGGILKLKKKYNESTISTIYSAIDDPERAIDIFNEALNYKNNTNTIKTGTELYDLLVDNGKGGMEGFWDVLSNIAEESGVVSPKMRAGMDAQAHDLFENMFEDTEGNAESLPQSKK